MDLVDPDATVVAVEAVSNDARFFLLALALDVLALFVLSFGVVTALMAPCFDESLRFRTDLVCLVEFCCCCLGGIFSVPGICIRTRFPPPIAFELCFLLLLL